MVTEDKMQEEIDKATEALAITQIVEVYARLLQIKHSEDVLKEINRELHLLEIKMDCLGIEYMPLKEFFVESDD